MKRKFLLALLSFVMLITATLGFVACGDDEDNYVAGTLEYTFNQDYTQASCFGPNNKMLQKAEVAAEVETTNDEGETVKVPVTEIRAGAFVDCVAMKEISIPKTVKTIPAGTFNGCVNLEKITVDSANEYFKAENQSLYNKDGTKLVQYALGKADKTFTVPQGVTEVADYALSGAKKLDSVVINEGVTKLGLGMLYSTSIKEITLPFIGDKLEEATNETLKYLFLKSKEEAAVIPATLTKVNVNGTKISDSAFDGFENLTEISIGKNVTEIHVEGFLSCVKLEKFVVDSDNPAFKSFENNLYDKAGTTLYRYAIGNKATTFVLPSEVNVISDGALSGCSYVAEITVENGNQFYKAVDGNLYDISGQTLIQYAIASKATSFDIPEGVQTVSAYSFANSASLAEVSIPNTVSIIEEGAFSGASKINEIIVPDSVKEFGSNVFEGCVSLNKLTVPFIGQNQMNEQTGTLNFFFAGVVPSSLNTVNITNAIAISANAFLNLKQITNVTLNEGILSIGDDAFNACVNLTSITIPTSVTSIGKASFKSCEKIESIAIPENVITIGDSAFQGCLSVNTLTIGQKVTQIGKEAFNGCSGVTEITIPATVESIGDLVFYGMTKLSAINVAEGNQNYKDIDGDLYTKDGTELIQYSAGKSATEFTVLNDVLEIKESAFYSAINLTKIVVPSTVELIGKNAFASCNNLAEIVLPFAGKSANAISTSAWLREAFGSLPTSLKKVEITNQSKIAVTAFADCTYIETIVLSSAVKEIGNAAFRGCISLKEINTENVEVIGERAFQDCSALTSLDFTNAINVGAQAFDGCSSLTTLTFGVKLSKIGVRFNSDCTSLTTITVDSANTGASAKDNALYQGNVLVGYATNNSATSLTIKDNTIKIEASALENAKNLKSVTIPATVGEIGEYAFAGSGIESISISASKIGAHAFENCSNLTTVNLGTNLLVIGDYAFAGCTKISTLNVPEGTTEIGTFAFSSCSSLENVSIPDSIEVLGSNVFRLCDDLKFTEKDGAKYVGNTNNPYVILVKATSTDITTLTIQNKTKYISELAFMGCAKLTKVTIPASVKSIGAGAFMDCSALKTLVINNGVKTIGGSAFYNCDALITVTIPNSVETVGKYAFSGCDKLKTLRLGDNVTTLGAGFVKDCKSLTTITLNVTSGWKYYELSTKDVNGDGVTDEFDGYQATGKSVSSSDLSANNIVKAFTETHVKRLIKR